MLGIIVVEIVTVGSATTNSAICPPDPKSIVAEPITTLLPPPDNVFTTPDS